MLNLKIMMRTLMVLSFTYNLLIPSMCSQSAGIVLTNSPRPNQTIQGTVTILGTTRIAAAGLLLLGIYLSVQHLIEQ